MPFRHTRSLLLGSCLASVAAACGTVPNEPAPSPDANAMPPDAEPPPPDAEPPPPRCDPSLPFGEPTLLPNVNTANAEYGAALTADEKVLFMARFDLQGQKFRLYESQRASIDDDFPAPRELTTLNTFGYEKHPSATPDGLTLYFISDGDAYVARRSGRTADFGAAAKVDAVSTGEYEDDVTVAPSGLYFMRAVGDRGGELAHVASRAGGGFEDVTFLTELNSVGSEGEPVLSHDERRILFFSTRTDGGAEGYHDIYEATRATASDRFGTPVNLHVLNTADGDMPEWLSDDGCALYLSSNRPGGTGDWDLYVARRPPPSP